MESLFRLGVLVQAIDNLTGPARRMVGSITDLNTAADRARAMTDFGTRMSVSGAMVQGAAETMRNSISGLVDPLLKVQDAAAPLQTVITSTMGSVEKSMKAATDAAMDWSKVHKASASEFIQTSYLMAGAGLNDVQAIEGTKAALAMATATMGDNASAANLLAVVYNNMGDKTKDVKQEMGRLADVLTGAQAYFQYANMDALNESLKYAIPTALQARMSLEQLNAVLGQLNNDGMQGSMAGTAFTAAMAQMQKASNDLGFTIAKTADGGVDFIGTLDNITAKYGDLSRASPKVQMAFQQAFGIEGQRAILLLQNQTKDMSKALDGLKNSAGAAGAAQTTMEATASAQMQILKNNIDAVKMELAAQLLPLLQDVVPKIKEIVTQFAGWAKGHPDLIKTAALIAVIAAGLLTLVAPILIVGGSFLTMSGYAIQGYVMVGKKILWFKGLLTSPATIDAIKMLFLNMKIGASMAGEAIMGAARSAGTMALSLGRATLGAIKFAVTAAGQAAVAAGRMALSLLAMGKQAIFTAITALPGLIASTWAFTAALLANPVTWIVIGIIALIAAIILLVQNWDTVSAAFAAGWSFLKAGWASLMDTIKGGLDAVVNWLTGMVDTFKNSGKALWGAFTEGLKSVISGPVDAVKSGLQMIRNMLPFSDAKTGPLSELTKSGQKLITTFQGGAETKFGGLQKAMATGLAGIALIAPLPQMPDKLPTMTGSAQYEMANASMTPTLPPLNGIAKYEMAAPVAPSLAPLTGVAQYEMASAPVLSVPKATDILTAEAPDLSRLAPAPVGTKDGTSSGTRPIVIQGDVHLHVDQVDNPDDLWQTLRRFAEEVSG